MKSGQKMRVFLFNNAFLLVSEARMGARQR